MARKNQKININLTSGDLAELEAGRTFDWTFPTEKGENIDVHLYQSDDYPEDDEQK